MSNPDETIAQAQSAALELIAKWKARDWPKPCPKGCGAMVNDYDEDFIRHVKEAH